MPFQSDKQRRYLWANEPEIAREWTNRYGASQGGLTRLRQAYPTNLTVGEEMQSIGTPLENQMAKVYDKNALTGVGAESGFFGANDQLEALEDYYNAATDYSKSGLGKHRSPSEIRDYIDRAGGVIGLGVPNIDMNLIPKDFLENKRDYQEQKSPYDLIKGDESSLNTLSNNRYVDSGMFGTDATYVDDTNQGGIDTINIDEMADVYSPYENYGQFFRNQPTDERNMLTGLQEKGSGIVDFLMNKGTGLRQGLSLANENYLMPAVAGVLGIANRYNPLSKGSQNYNPDLQNQIDMLKASGHLGGGDPSGPYKITSGPLAGKNLVSAFGTNDYGRMLDKKLAYFQKRKDDKKSYSQKLWDDAKKEKERIEKEKQKSGTNIGGGWTRHDTGGGRATFTGSGGQTHQGYSNTQAGYGTAASEWGSS